ncbi:unnamed protein product [Cyprideis torosa]|uniref:E3 ubiquitin-protein ligase NRDP1 n=1 Tax=Cyprideis torosa TaxID=163714 RepID=A0A7R8WEI9_9CRUS|nr:unnamed protein product [Cyprideis torosa]CAG0889552.1 unnamed protein product [Cyprideis torosa]
MGYDLARFPCPPDEDLTCSICSGVLENPVQAPQCEHAFCNLCIKQWLTQQLTCPIDRLPVTVDSLKPVPRILRNMLARVEIECDNKAHGCPEKIKLEALNQHLEQCQYNPKFPVECPNECGLKVPKDEIQQHNCIRELRTVLQTQQNKLKEAVSELQEQKTLVSELRREVGIIREFMRVLCINNPSMYALAEQVQHDEVLAWSRSLPRARVTRWGGMISTPDDLLQATIRRALQDSGCPSHVVNLLMENTHERRWPPGLATLEIRQSNRRLYENYLARRIPGKQAVVIMACENEMMSRDMVLDPGLKFLGNFVEVEISDVLAMHLEVALTRSPAQGFGFSLFGGPQSVIPVAVIQRIAENSPAALSKQLYRSYLARRLCAQSHGDPCRTLYAMQAQLAKTLVIDGGLVGRKRHMKVLQFLFVGEPLKLYQPLGSEQTSNFEFSRASAPVVAQMWKRLPLLLRCGRGSRCCSDVEEAPAVAQMWKSKGEQHGTTGTLISPSKEPHDGSDRGALLPSLPFLPLWLNVHELPSSGEWGRRLEVIDNKTKRPPYLCSCKTEYKIEPSRERRNRTGFIRHQISQARSQSSQSSSSGRPPLQQGDQIVSVNRLDVTGLSSSEVLKQLREAGDHIVLGIRRENEGEGIT